MDLLRAPVTAAVQTRLTAACRGQHIGSLAHTACCISSCNMVLSDGMLCGFCLCTKGQHACMAGQQCLHQHAWVRPCCRPAPQLAARGRKVHIVLPDGGEYDRTYKM